MKKRGGNRAEEYLSPFIFDNCEDILWSSLIGIGLGLALIGTSSWIQKVKKEKKLKTHKFLKERFGFNFFLGLLFDNTIEIASCSLINVLTASSLLIGSIPSIIYLLFCTTLLCYFLILPPACYKKDLLQKEKIPRLQPLIYTSTFLKSLFIIIFRKSFWLQILFMVIAHATPVVYTLSKKVFRTHKSMVITTFFYIESILDFILLLTTISKKDTIIAVALSLRIVYSILNLIIGIVNENFLFVFHKKTNKVEKENINALEVKKKLI